MSDEKIHPHTIHEFLMGREYDPVREYSVRRIISRLTVDSSLRTSEMMLQISLGEMVSGVFSRYAWIDKTMRVMANVRDYTIDAINQISIRVENGDQLKFNWHWNREEEINRAFPPNGQMTVPGLMRNKPKWTFGGKPVDTHTPILVCPPLMLNLYRLKHQENKP